MAFSAGKQRGLQGFTSLWGWQEELVELPIRVLSEFLWALRTPEAPSTGVASFRGVEPIARLQEMLNMV